MSVQEDGRCECTTEITTLNHALGMVAFNTSVEVCNPISCRRPCDAIDRSPIFGCNDFTRRVFIRTHYPNLPRSNTAPQPLIDEAGTIGRNSPSSEHVFNIGNFLHVLALYHRDRPYGGLCP